MSISSRRMWQVRKLLEMCGSTFAVHDVEGSRTKKLFAIAEEREDQLAASSALQASMMLPVNVDPALPEQTMAAGTAIAIAIARTAAAQLRAALADHGCCSMSNANRNNYRRSYSRHTAQLSPLLLTAHGSWHATTLGSGSKRSRARQQRLRTHRARRRQECGRQVGAQGAGWWWRRGCSAARCSPARTAQGGLERAGGWGVGRCVGGMGRERAAGACDAAAASGATRCRRRRLGGGVGRAACWHPRRRHAGV